MGLQLLAANDAVWLVLVREAFATGYWRAIPIGVLACLALGLCLSMVRRMSGRSQSSVQTPLGDLDIETLQKVVYQVRERIVGCISRQQPDIVSTVHELISSAVTCERVIFTFRLCPSGFR